MPAPMPSRRVPSTQQDQVPEAVSPDARRDATAELGAEGGSYGDLTQSVRAEREWGAAPERQSTWRLAPAALVVLLMIVAVILAVTFWAMGT